MYTFFLGIGYPLQKYYVLRKYKSSVLQKKKKKHPKNSIYIQVFFHIIPVYLYGFLQGHVIRVLLSIFVFSFFPTSALTYGLMVCKNILLIFIFWSVAVFFLATR